MDTVFQEINLKDAKTGECYRITETNGGFNVGEVVYSFDNASQLVMLSDGVRSGRPEKYKGIHLPNVKLVIE